MMINLSSFSDTVQLQLQSITIIFVLTVHATKVMVMRKSFVDVDGNSTSIMRSNLPLCLKWIVLSVERGI